MIDILTEQEHHHKNYTVKCSIAALDKGYLVLITDQAEYGIGEVILGTPSMLDGGNLLVHLQWYSDSNIKFLARLLQNVLLLN